MNNTTLSFPESCPADVVAAFNALDLSNRVRSGSLIVEHVFDYDRNCNAWSILDSVFNVIAVMRDGKAVIVANKRRNK